MASIYITNFGTLEDGSYITSITRGGSDLIFVAGASVYTFEGNHDLDPMVRAFQSGNPVWDLSFGSPEFGIETFNDIKFSDGYIYGVGGISNGFDTSLLLGSSWPNYKPQDPQAGAGFIVKIDPANGQILASNIFGSDSRYNDSPVSIAFDVSGNVFVTGSTSEGAFLGEQIGSGSYLAKFSTDLSLVWGKVSYGTGYSSGNTISTDSSSNVYISGNVGDINGAAGSIDGLDVMGKSDAFIQKYDPDGNLIWTHLYGDNGEIFNGAKGFVIDSEGNLFLSTTSENHSLDYTLDPDYISNKMYKINGINGEILWDLSYGSQFPGSDANSDSKALSFDSAGNIVVSGYTNVGLNGIPSLGDFDGFILKISPSGEIVSTLLIGSPGSEAIRQAFIDDNDNLFVAGDFSSKEYSISETSEYTDIYLISTVGFTLNGDTRDNYIQGGVGDDTIYAAAGNDTIKGGDGNDLIIGGDGAGNDSYNGGNGVDTVSYTSALTDIVVNLNAGFATTKSTTTYTSLRTANPTNSDTSNIGNDTLSNIENVIASNYNDTLIGNKSNNTLNGGLGNDTMAGGAGNDTYIVDSLNDIVTEKSTAGTDIIQTTLAVYSLADINNVENLSFTGIGNASLTGNVLNNLITGGFSDDTLNGGAGNDILNGGAGTDTLIGGAGNDIYIINNTSEHAAAEITDSGGTADEIRFASENADETLTLYAGDTGVDKIVIGTGTAATAVTTGTTNLNVDASLGLNKLTIIGNSGNNNLVGTNFNDNIQGGLGNDTLNGGAGNDILIGGSGDDTYYVNNALDVVTEALNGGTDIVYSQASTYTLSANVETLILSNDISVLSGVGNATANTIEGNSFNNTLNGGAGNDILVGGEGNDTYIVDSASDTITELEEQGTDTVQSSANYVLTHNVENLTLTGSKAINATGNNLANTLVGNSAANILNGGDGEDILIGGLGNDTYVVDSITDTITEDSGRGTDTVQSSVTFTLGANVENLTLTGSSVIDGTGNSLNNTITGNSLNNTLDGGAGIDTLVGGLGDDTYVVDNIKDKVTESASAGTDTIQSSVTIKVLAANVENLELTGTSTINGTGNSLANTITGNSVNNILNGGAGNDTLNGGLGNDTLTGGTGLDIFLFDTALGVSNVDTLTDFNLTQDKIRLDDDIFSSLSSIEAENFVSAAGATALEVDDFLIFNTTNNFLYYDADGSGADAMVHFATLNVDITSHTSFELVA